MSEILKDLKGLANKKVRLLTSALGGTVLLGLIGSTPVNADSCNFNLGFKTIHDQMADQVGNCTEPEHYAPNGDSIQHSVNGLLAWRKSDNWTAFTNGYMTWVNGPRGIQSRLNTERFPWEANDLQTVSLTTPAAPSLITQITNPITTSINQMSPDAKLNYVSSIRITGTDSNGQNIVRQVMKEARDTLPQSHSGSEVDVPLPQTSDIPNNLRGVTFRQFMYSHNPRFAARLDEFLGKLGSPLDEQNYVDHTEIIDFGGHLGEWHRLGSYGQFERGITQLDKSIASTGLIQGLLQDGSRMSRVLTVNKEAGSNKGDRMLYEMGFSEADSNDLNERTLTAIEAPLLLNNFTYLDMGYRQTAAYSLLAWAMKDFSRSLLEFIT